MGFLRNRIGNANQEMALENTALIQALNKAQAVIWFDLEGNILDAQHAERFLRDDCARLTNWWQLIERDRLSFA